MYPYLSLVERKVAEFYHNIDRTHWLVWVKMTYFHRFFWTIPGVLVPFAWRFSWSEVFSQHLDSLKKNVNVPKAVTYFGLKVQNSHAWIPKHRKAHPAILTPVSVFRICPRYTVFSSIERRFDSSQKEDLPSVKYMNISLSHQQSDAYWTLKKIFLHRKYILKV